jgi:hypothetical protein
MKRKFTKEMAIDLWFKFIESKNVRKSTNGYGNGGYMQFILTLEKMGNSIEHLTLITQGLYSNQDKKAVTETAFKDLCTPYGNFNLSVEEANKCRDAWQYRDKSKNHLDYESLLTLL